MKNHLLTISILFLCFLLIFISSYSFSECIEGDCQNGHGTFVYHSRIFRVQDPITGKITKEEIDFGDKHEQYVGEWKKGKKHGRGTYTDINNREYDGEWKNDRRDGHGTLTNLDNGKKYVGQWKDGKRHGYGVKRYSGGESKKGYWLDNEYVGKEKPKELEQ